MLKDKIVVLGVCGGIAAYKAADLASRMRKAGAQVHVIMTSSATEFITPLTFRTLTGNPVITNMFDEPSMWDVAHISLAAKANIFVIAPATANIIGKVAGGIADDMLSTTIMAAKCPVMFAPAMNTNMYENPIVQDNIERLTGLGYIFIEPETGRLACGDTGKGRLADNSQIIETVEAILYPFKDLKEKRILITAGPTKEYLDAVRFISNPSSGKMGYAIAAAAAMRGASVCLVSGATDLKPPSGVELIKVVSAQDMHTAVLKNAIDCDIIIKAAAVGDFKPMHYSEHKLKKEQIKSIELDKNPDILLDVATKYPNKTIIGFCMETQDLKDNAYKKLIAKGADLIVANNLFTQGAGFGTDTNSVSIIDKNGNIIDYPNMPKQELAHIILDNALKIYNSKA